jgi:phosphate starvation-inducible PhoH-like protein|tara:strand:- start:71 stop:733 length:663 start_codon:yes stop_codon:yes gene_type:complete
MGKRSKTLNGSGLELAEIEPLTRNQLIAFESSQNLVLHGCAGTGKTFISCYLAFDDMTKNMYEKLVIIRSAVPTRDIGFLPGTEKEKSSVYEEPYYDIAIDLFERGDAYQILKTKRLVHFMTTSYIRGITLRDAVILIDECQNMTFHELDSIITRVGENCRVIFCGDFKQSDLKQNGMGEFLEILDSMNRFDFIEFGVEDIVRSGFVKDYIIAREYKQNL